MISRCKFIFFSAIVVLLIAIVIGCNQENKADLVLTNGKIVTVDDNMPEAQALAIRGDVIIAIGTNKEMDTYIDPSTKILDLEGKFAIPGFIDGHGHFLSLGQSKMRLNLMTAHNWDEIVTLVKEAVDKARPGDWILGRGWHQEKWDRVPQPEVDGLPLHHALSRISPDNPVLLSHASGHSSIANAKAMELAGITKEIADPSGGEIVRDEAGNPIGVFRETAMGLVGAALDRYLENRTPEQIEAEQRRAIELAVQECLSRGITSFQDAGASFATIDLFKKLVREKKLGIRLWVMINENNKNLAQRLDSYKIVNYGDNRLTVRAVKMYIDGALGAHGAWLLQPYADLPSSSGLNTTSPESLAETAEFASQHGLQMCTHAIGDRGNREILNIYEATFNKHPDKQNLRWRIEHAQHLHPNDIPRFGQLGVIASMQGIHCTSDGPWVIKRLGEKRAREGAYAWQSLMNSGAIVSNGTDTPVEDVNPIACFYATVTRKLTDGTYFYPGQKMTRQEALRSYTLHCAYAAFEENIKGSLTPGKLADISVLSQDLMTIPDDEILNTTIIYTIVGGEVMYQR